MPELLMCLNDDLKLGEALVEALLSGGKDTDSEKKGKTKSTANQSYQKTKSPECEQTHDLLQCPKVKYQKDRDVLRVQHMQGPDSSRGRGGRGTIRGRGGGHHDGGSVGFDAGRGRGHAGRCEYSGDQYSEKQSHHTYEPHHLCFRCLSLGHREVISPFMRENHVLTRRDTSRIMMWLIPQGISVSYNTDPSELTQIWCELDHCAESEVDERWTWRIGSDHQ